MQSHIDGCASCAHEMEMATSTLTAIRELPAERCPDAVVEDLFSSVADETGVPEPGGFIGGLRGSVMRPALAASLALAVIVAGIAVERWHESRTHVTPEEVAKAEAALKWTFAYVNDVSRRAGFAVRDEVIGEHVVGRLRAGVHRVTSGDRSTPPEENNGGS